MTNRITLKPYDTYDVATFVIHGDAVYIGHFGGSYDEAGNKLLTVEDSGRPLSDQKIVELLRREHSIEIARRTVAKYRSQLKILSSSRRKRYS